MPVTDVIQQLLIVKGVAPAVGDTTSAEQGLTSVDLLTQAQQSGFSLDAENGWNPAIASLKGGGVWADSAVSSGRQLLSNEEANVVETMQLSCTGLNVPDLAAHLSKMSRMIADARDFSATGYQIEPVYLKWQAVGATGPQYALIYNMEMAIVEPTDFTATGRELTLTIEREPYWRGVAPGANPKVWTFFVDDVVSPTLAQWNLWTAEGGGFMPQLFTDLTLANQREWNTTQTDVLSRNYLDIPAARIPGDAPALLELLINVNMATLTESVIVARQTIPVTRLGRDGLTKQSVLTINAGDNSALGTDTTIAADTGAPRSNSSASGQRANCTFATVTAMEHRLTWGGSGETKVGLALSNGVYAVFCRARLSAAGTVALRISMCAGTALTVISTTPVNLTDAGVGGTGNTTEWAFLYLGTITIPWSSQKPTSSVDGRGLNVTSNSNINNFNLMLDAQRVSGTPVLYVSDLFLCPISDPSFIITTSNDQSWTGLAAVVDNTGYFHHGDPTDYHGAWTVSQTPNPDQFGEYVPTQLEGRLITLEPGKTNRLHFLTYDRSTMRSALQTSAFSIYGNIVPRWRHIRDV